MADKLEVDPGSLDISDELIAERRAYQPGQTPETMTGWQRPITAAIDVLNLWVGRITCLLLVPIILVMVYEVVAAKLFVAPTLWVYDTSRMLAGVVFMLGAGYALMRGVHIRADFIYRGWMTKTQATVDAVLYLAFYFPAMLFFFWSAADYALDAFNPRNGFAYEGWERASDSTWAPVLGPARLAMPVGALLLLLQGIPELFRAFNDMGRERERWFLWFLPVYLAVLGALFAGTFFPGTVPLGSYWFDFVQSIGLTDFDKPTIGLFMIGAMLFAIFVGFPISFTLIFLAFVFAAWGISAKLGFFLQTLKFNETMLDDQLVAVPLFVFMGIMMEKAGLMERLFTSIQMMMSRTRGALFIAVLFVSIIFAAATGIVGASVTILGIMAAKTMNRSGYDVRMAAGTITAGGTLGILIPPSIMLVVMGPVLEVPVTDLFAAAIVPGILLAVLYIGYTVGRCWLDPSLGPILPIEEQPETSPYYVLEFVLVLSGLVAFFYLVFTNFLYAAIWFAVMAAAYHLSRAVKPFGFYFSDLWSEFFMGLVPPTILVAFALGSILLGWATPAEAAACGAFGAVLLTILYMRFTVTDFYDSLIKTLEITVLIMFLVAASNFFGAVFSSLGTPKMLTELLLSLEMPTTMVLIAVMALIFLLGWPLEWVPIVLIIVPILIPMLTELNVNLTWFAILVAVNLQTAWLSPPVALSAYFLKGVVPEWDLKDIYLGMMQFMLIQLIGLALIMMFPQIALWLPGYIYGK
ncbi:MAG: TRAP transporter large permease subunit [Alphaproteobacteria bacterium]|nr:TRAP transporter large permease subunit [Alphaproteobacteria bacterium]